MEEKLLTTDELCKWLKVSRPTIWRWRKQGLPYTGTERSIRYQPEQVMKWLDNQKSKEEATTIK